LLKYNSTFALNEILTTPMLLLILWPWCPVIPNQTEHFSRNHLELSYKDIKSVVAMVPHSELSAHRMGEIWKERVFVVERPGLDVTDMGGYEEQDNEL
jgi:hypothetical protein